MIEHLIDKPTDRTVDEWLREADRATNLNVKIEEEWMEIDGHRALRVRHRNTDLTESENFYVVSGTKTFTIRAAMNMPSRSVYQQMISTFRFTRF